MRRFSVVAIIVSLFFVAVAGCSQPAWPLADLDPEGEVTAGLAHTLEQSVWGSQNLVVDERPGMLYFGQVHGRVRNTVADEVVAYNFVGTNLLPAEPVEVASDGTWGPLEVVHGPKVIVAYRHQEMVGYWLSPMIFAMQPLQDTPAVDSFAVDPAATGLIALALYYADQPQAATDVLARIQDLHRDKGGIPQSVDCFGQAADDEIDVTATAWAGYAALKLARASNLDALWQQTEAYASYLADLPVPDDAEARLAGWLLFDGLAREEQAGYQQLAEQWQLEEPQGYCPWYALYAMVAGNDYQADEQFQPDAGQVWLHYLVLADQGIVPEGLDAQVEELLEAGSGLAVADEDKSIDLRETAWMILALAGAFR